MIFVKGKSVFINLNTKDIIYCKELSLKREKREIWGNRANEKNKKYRTGIINTDNDPTRVARIGLYGEKAFNILTGIPIDESISDRGDEGWDFIIGKNPETKIDIKNSAYEPPLRSNNYGEFYLRADSDEKGKFKKLKSDIYVFSSIAYHNGTTKNAKGFLSDLNATNVIVQIHGYIHKDNILKNKTERLGDPIIKNSKNWKNYYINKKELLSMTDFLWEYRYDLKWEKADLII